MALLRRVSLFTLRNAQRRGGGKGGSFWSEGTKEPEGYLFNETPPPPGQKRKWESWELPWYLGFGSFATILTLGLTFKPNTFIQAWAREQAEKELAAERLAAEQLAAGKQ